MGSVPALSYPSLSDLLLRSRVAVNDTFRGATGTPGEGRVFVDSAPWTLPLVNESIAEYQRYLDNAGITTNIKEVFFLANSNTAIPPINGPNGVAVPDPAVRQHLHYTGFFDGFIQHAQPQLPSDLLVPKKMWERMAGTGLTFSEFMPVEDDGGLGSLLQGTTLGAWEFRADGLWWNGSLVPQELRLRYIGQAGFFGLPLAPEQFPTTPLPFRDCLEALSLLVAEKFCAARLPAGATDGLLAKYTNVMQMIVNRHTLALQTRRFSRAPYGDDGDYFYGYW